MKRLKEIKALLEAVDLYVEIDTTNNEEYLVVKRKAASKKDLCEILFTKKGEVEHIVIGSAPDNAAWINVSPKRITSKKVSARTRKQLEWYGKFADYIESAKPGLYNEACEFADEN